MKAFKKEIYRQCDLMAIKKNNVARVHRRNITQCDSGERCGPWASCFNIKPIHFLGQCKTECILLQLLDPIRVGSRRVDIRSHETQSVKCDLMICACQ
jgi:hypothetical protein